MTEYAVTTPNATNVVRATAQDDVDITVKLNGNNATNGNAFSWKPGVNVVEVTVTQNGVSTVYTVTVTKE